MALNSEDFFLIHGPFGTGKTRTLLELIRQEVKKGSKILATAESNTAVDNILEGLLNEDVLDESDFKINCVRLGHPQRVSRANIHQTLAYKVENHPLNSKIAHLKEGIKKTIEEREKHTKPTPGFRRGLSDTQILLNAVKRRGSRGVSPNVMISMGRWIENNKKVDESQQKIQEIEKSIVENIIKKASVVLCTNSSAGLEYLKGTRFDLAVIDESSQATIPSVLIPISKARRFILAGDHRQLPPTIVNHKARELEKTLFEGLINNYPQNSTMLNIQYRMNPDLMEFPNNEFYGGKIKAGKSINNISIQDIDCNFSTNNNNNNNNNKQDPDRQYNDCSKNYGITDDNLNPQFKNIQKDLMDPDIPFIFLNTSRLDEKFEKQIKGSTSIQNPLEADLVSLITSIFIKSGINPEKIGIISPYEDQRDLISSLTNVEVKTVDGYQGREKDIMIISTVRSNAKRKIGFLNDLRRLNVALTRARRKMIMIGDVKTLEIHPTYRRLIENSQEKGCLKDVNF
jgi:superfamily I DNA and/or RNA helicase